MCDQVIDAGTATFASVYGAVWDFISFTETADRMANYHQTISLMKTKVTKPCRQVQNQIADLYDDAAWVHISLFKPFLDSIAEHTKTLPKEAPLKKLSRILEKVMTDPQEPGNCAKICDMCRGMLEATSIKQV